ncbi:hypothetical protein CHS0354_012076 [Potamilus streckersoni]|uniref:Uncharacterized protein n=1 Tax=Potamilus streckersoni TaxID=2493646 RepID=A0AAE0VT37_9BIVA|nr:hypothetical protein CHS0354_012076 [Potamilus streckersoni]
MGKCLGKISSNSAQKPPDGEQSANSVNDNIGVDNIIYQEGHLIHKEFMLKEQETKMVEIPTVVSCPFCNYFTAMHKMDENVFSCQNPKCLMNFYSEESVRGNC